MRKNLKEKRGITLVALVITIIVLIILAGVSINAGINGGLIKNSKEAKAEWDNGVKEEQKEMDKLEYLLAESKEGTVANKAKVGTVVQYKYKKADGTEQEVEYVTMYNDSENGVQLMPIDAIGETTIGSSEPEEAKKISINLQSILEQEALKYATDNVISARVLSKEDVDLLNEIDSTKQKINFETVSTFSNVIPDGAPDSINHYFEIKDVWYNRNANEWSVGGTSFTTYFMGNQFIEGSEISPVKFVPIFTIDPYANVIDVTDAGVLVLE